MSSTFKSELGPFRSNLAETVFVNKYQHEGCETWDNLAATLANDVCGRYLVKSDVDEIAAIIRNMEFIPAGRYLYYAGRATKYFNNCYLLRAEADTREDWAELSKKAELCLMTGGGIGVDYSRYRPSGAVIRRTGGKASGPVPKMFMINEIGRNVIQGGSRRSAIYASLNWRHNDVEWFLKVKDWDSQPVGTSGLTYGDVKKQDFNFPAPLDMTNISVNYDTQWLEHYLKTGDSGAVFKENVRMALLNGEPGFSFNFWDKETETLRNACTEVCSSDDSDVCNLGSINLSRIENIDRFKTVVQMATKFLLCGTLVADVPYNKVHTVRAKNRRLGLGLMGVHEWLIKRGYKYEVVNELHQWLQLYKGVSNRVAEVTSDELDISKPVACRSVAPTGTIGMLAGTTTGIEPVFAVAMKRRYLVNGTVWRYQFSVDHVADLLIKELGVDPGHIESATELAKDYERRIKFQADVQDYVDMCISSTINMPGANAHGINVDKFASVVAKYSPRLRGLTVYPDGARGGQPLQAVPYDEAVSKLGKEYDESVVYTDVCDLTGKGICST